MHLTEGKKALLRLLADGRFHSGTELSTGLGVSRTAVWKHLHGIEALGLEIAAVAGRGYRLMQPLELLERETITAGLDPAARRLLAVLEIHDEIDSTNSRLVAGAKEGLPAGAVCLAETQRAGRGRRGREWVSPFGSNVYLSVLWRFEQGPAALSGLSLAAGVAVMEALSRAGVPGAGLKWPNDLYWRGRKLGGILVEVQGESGGPCAAVLGLGLNVYVPAADGAHITQSWVDLRQIMGDHVPSRNALVAGILNELLPMMDTYERTGLSPYLPAWRAFDCTFGKRACLYLGETKIDGTVRGITDDGLLIMEDDQGHRRHYPSGEVSFSG